jgi:hypothetical protein
VSIPRENLEEILKNLLVDFEGHEFFVFEMAALKEADTYGKTHTAYIRRKVAAPKKKASRKKEAEE